jgi:hypothetical protein
LPDLQPAINLLFLPLLGGYLFLYSFNVTRPFTERLTGSRLVFHTATAGLLLLIAARLITVLADVFPDNGLPVEMLLWGVVPGLMAGLLFVLGRLTWIQFAKDPSFKGYKLRALSGVLLFGGLCAAGAKVATLDPKIPDGSTFWAVAWGTVTFGVAYRYWRWLRTYMPEYPFASIAVRIVLLSLILSLSLIAAGAHGDAAAALWQRFSTIERSGTPFLALTIGVVLPWALNALVPYQASVASLHRRERSNSLERLLFNASIQTSLVQITLEDHKVYVGYVRHLPPNSSLQDAYVELLPSFSGYRNPTTHEIVFTTFYEDIFQEFLDDEARDLGDFYKVLPVRRIVSATVFDVDVYSRFHDPDEPETRPVEPSAPAA